MYYNIMNMQAYIFIEYLFIYSYIYDILVFTLIKLESLDI